MDGRVLVAGIGNVFLGDDGFGVAVAHKLGQRPLPNRIRVVDFGIRGFDLAFALLDDYEATILVDALARGGDPGTLYVLEPDPSGEDWPDPESVVEGHGLHPVKVLRLVKAMGGQPRNLVVVGCEPATFGEDEETMELSDPVRAAVDLAVDVVESLIGRIGGSSPVLGCPLSWERASEDRTERGLPNQSSEVCRTSDQSRPE